MQLVEHKIRVIFKDARDRDVKMRVVDCADLAKSRELGREIAQWLAKGVGYQIESITVTCVRR